MHNRYKQYVPSILDLLQTGSKTELEYLIQFATEQKVQDTQDEDIIDSETDANDETNPVDEFDKKLESELNRLFDSQDVNTDMKESVQDKEDSAESNVEVDDGEEKNEEKNRQLEEVKQDIERLKVLDRLRFLITAVPKLELIIMALPGYIAEKEPLILVYMLDKITEIKYLIRYLIANVDSFDTDVLDLLISELEDFIDELVNAARQTITAAK